MRYHNTKNDPYMRNNLRRSLEIIAGNDWWYHDVTRLWETESFALDLRLGFCNMVNVKD